MIGRDDVCAESDELHEERRRSSQAGLAAVVAGAQLAGLVVVEPDDGPGGE